MMGMTAEWCKLAGSQAVKVQWIPKLPVMLMHSSEHCYSLAAYNLASSSKSSFACHSKPQ